MPVKECLKGVMAPKGNVTSFSYVPGDEIELSAEDAKELEASGHVGNKGDFKKLLKIQQENNLSGLGEAQLRAEIAKLRNIIAQKDAEIAKLQAQMAKGK